MNENEQVHEMVDEKYLRDESRKTGNAVSISFPDDENEVKKIIRQMNSDNINVTIQGSRTGVTGGAVPFGGHIINLERMDKVTGISYDGMNDAFFVEVQPGVLLSNLREMIETKKFDTIGWSVDSLEILEIFQKSGEWFFPPDPTETSASVGGMAACNASGARTYFYGPSRNHIEALSIVTSNASLIRLERGRSLAIGNEFALTSDDGVLFKGMLPSYIMPDVKNAAGYFVKYGMELIDLFIGSEGTLGIITSIKLKLTRKPRYIWGMTSFIDDENKAIEFVQVIRRATDESNGTGEKSKLAAIEYFNKNALDMLRDMKKNNEAFSRLPEITGRDNVAVYLEFHAHSEEQVCNMSLEAVEVLEQCGGNGADTWLASNAAEMQRMHYFRHAIPEAVNLTIDIMRKNEPGISKLGTDMAVPDDRLSEVMHMYNEDLSREGLRSVIFGHIGNNHLHVNIIPCSLEEYKRGFDIYLGWAQKVVAMGGTISAEHGVGKLKTALFRQMYGNVSISMMKDLKDIFDPKGLLNQGNLF